VNYLFCYNLNFFRYLLWRAITNFGRYFAKAIQAKTKTKHFSGIRYAYSVTTKWVSIEKYEDLRDLYNFSLENKKQKNRNQNKWRRQ